MNDYEYRQFCYLQEQTRAAGFTQDFDQALRMEVTRNRPHFTISCIRWGEPTDDRAVFHLNYYKLDGSSDYALDHYEAIYRRPIEIPNERHCGVNLSALEDRMRMINWNYLTQTAASKDIFQASPAQVNEIILSICDDLETLSGSPEGRRWRELIEAKYLSDTTPVWETAAQSLYDRINKDYAVTYTIPVKGTDTIPIQLLDELFEQDLPLPAILQKKHEVYRVETDGYRTRKDQPGEFDQFVQLHFFSSLDKAVAHIEKVDQKLFQPFHVIWGKQDFVYKEMAIVDEMDNTWIASKRGKWSGMAAVDMKANVIRWELNGEATTPQAFGQKSGLDLTGMGCPADAPNAFQVYPPLHPTPAQQPSADLKPPRVKKNRGKGNRL